jgi:hypothetical protein
VAAMPLASSDIVNPKQNVRRRNQALNFTSPSPELLGQFGYYLYRPG